MPQLQDFIATVAEGTPLSRDEAREAFDLIMSGKATPSQIGGFLMALRVRGEEVSEILGAVSSMRSMMTNVSAPVSAMDIVGTGGDGQNTYNVSTCAAIVVAGCGVKVAKHGNRNVSSKSGAADVLTELGVNIDLQPDTISKCIKEAGLGFMFAPNHHSAMRHVGPTRKELGTRTVFNLLGPISNPAGVKRHLIGVFSKQWVEPIAKVLKELGSERFWIVHGHDGLDEISTTGPTFVAELANSEISTFETTPEAAGLNRVSIESLRGGDAKENALAINGVLEGDLNPFRDIVLLNAGAALVVAEKAGTIEEGVNLAAKSIDSGSAKDHLKMLVEVSNG